MIDMSIVWMLGVLSVGQNIVDEWIVQPWVFTAMAGLFVTSMIMRNLQMRFWPMLRGGAPIQFDNIRMELPTEGRLLNRRLGEAAGRNDGDGLFRTAINPSPSTPIFDAMDRANGEIPF